MGSQVFHLADLWRDLRDRLQKEGMFVRERLSLGDLGHPKSVWMLPLKKSRANAYQQWFASVIQS